MLIRLKSIGDIVFTLPAVHVVRDNFPGARISYLVSKEHAAVLEGFSEVDEVIHVDRALFRRKNPVIWMKGAFALWRQLRSRSISLAIDFQGYGETALMTWLTRAPERWGSVYQPNRRWAYTHGLERINDIQMADWNRLMLEKCGLKTSTIRNEFRLPAAAMDAARAFLAANGCDPRQRMMFIQPFTSAPQKDWPLDSYLALARHFQTAGVRVLFGGGPADHAALAPARALGFITSAGVPLLTSAGLARLSEVVIGGVTGLLHIAVAMQKRVVMLVGKFGREYGLPYQHPDWIVTPVEGELVATIQLGAVIRECERAFAEREAAGLKL